MFMAAISRGGNMIRKLALAVSLAVGTLPMSVYALGVGDMTTYSALNEKFKADIELVSVEKGTLDTIKVSLAPAEVFSRVGLERGFLLTRLKFEPMRLKNGKTIVRVSSNTPIKEPFLDFFVRVDWPNGQLIREYTALLDPPVVTKRRAPKVKAATQQRDQATASPASAVPGMSQARTESEYGPVQSNETLWEIADNLRPSGVSIHQMMMALYKANPDAFLRNNINLLKKGRVLQVPSVDEISSVGRKQAVSEFQQQAQAWKDGMQQATVAATEAKQVEEVPVSAANSIDEEDAQLKIAGAPTEESTAAGAEQVASDIAVGEDGELLKQKILLLQEESESAKLENVMLRSERDDLQRQLEDMRRLLELKDEELAQLQAGMSRATADANEEEVVADVSAADGGQETAEEVQPAEEVLQEEILAEAETAAPEPQATEPTPFLLDAPMAWVKDNWQLAAAGGGVLLLVLLAFGRRKKEPNEAEAAAPQVTERSGDQESILAEESSGMAESDAMPAGAIGDTSFLSEYSTEEFKGLQEDTVEVDPVSEADVYIAYGRYQQAEEILRNAMEAGDDSAAVKYKMLEVYYATQKKDEFAALAEEMVQSGQYKEDPKVWEHIQTMGRDLDKANPLFAAGAAGIASAAMETGGTEADSELTLDLSALADEV
ncbi:MAG TPA: hypothetical protein ENG92_03165, partial [Thiolapillus brandeum]|nr:hypothetical protein [Thiolapillus brandeum]